MASKERLLERLQRAVQRWLLGGILENLEALAKVARIERRSRTRVEDSFELMACLRNDVGRDDLLAHYAGYIRQGAFSGG